MKGKIFIGMGLSVLFIYLSFWKPQINIIFTRYMIDGLFGYPRVDVKLLVESLKSANMLFFLIVILLIYLGWWIRAWRWQILANPVKKVSARLAFSAMMIGYLGNNILPLRAGEFMRAYVIGKRAEVPISSALATVVVERVLDMVMLLFCFALSLMLFPLPGIFKNAGILTLLFTGFVVIFLLLLFYKRELALNIANFFLKIFPSGLRIKLRKLILGFADGLQIFRKSEHHFIAIAWTLIMWGVYLLIIYCSLYFYNFISDSYPEIAKAPLIVSIVMLTVTTAGVAMPSAPGAVGTYHGIALFGMGLFKVPPEIGLSYAILMHLSNFFPMTLTGLYCLFKEGMKLTELSGAARSRKDD